MTSFLSSLRSNAIVWVNIVQCKRELPCLLTAALVATQKHMPSIKYNDNSQ